MMRSVPVVTAKRLNYSLQMGQIYSLDFFRKLSILVNHVNLAIQRNLAIMVILVDLRILVILMILVILVILANQVILVNLVNLVNL